MTGGRGSQVALAGMKFSEDGSLMAYELASGGSDWHSMRIMRIDADTGQGSDLEDVLHHIKFSTTAWTHDNKAGSPDALAIQAPLQSALGTCIASCWLSPVHLPCEGCFHALRTDPGALQCASCRPFGLQTLR